MYQDCSWKVFLLGRSQKVTEAQPEPINKPAITNPRVGKRTGNAVSNVCQYEQGLASYNEEWVGEWALGGGGGGTIRTTGKMVWSEHSVCASERNVPPPRPNNHDRTQDDEGDGVGDGIGLPADSKVGCGHDPSRCGG